jgi:hypothetical protein
MLKGAKKHKDRLLESILDEQNLKAELQYDDLERETKEEKHN